MNNEDKIIEKRWEKKRAQISELANNIHRLRRKVTTDLKSPDEKERLTALVVAIMDKTGARVGNEESASEGHYGVTGFRKKHVNIDGNKVTLKYTGKSGVEHERTFTDQKIADGLKKAIGNSPDNYVFTTSSGFRIKPEKINRYLKDFGIRSKDIRGYAANALVIDKLEDCEIAEDEKKRKKNFNKAVKFVAAKIGHGTGTLQNHYLLPDMKEKYISGGEIIHIKTENYEKGGEIENSKKVSTLDITNEQIQDVLSGKSKVRHGKTIHAVSRYLRRSTEASPEGRNPNIIKKEEAQKKKERGGQVEKQNSFESYYAEKGSMLTGTLFPI